MNTGTHTRTITLIVLGLLLAITLLFILKTDKTPPVVEQVVDVVPEIKMKDLHVIGSSVENREIEVYTYGVGDTDLLFVGGIHGGYEWNSTLLAYAFIDHFDQNPEDIPDDITVHIIPSLNPDGLFKIVRKEGRFSRSDVQKADEPGLGRFNANDVDLNRNFDCKWQPESTWRGNVVSAGTGAFSEPEAKALKRYVEQVRPDAVAFWHSQSNAVYASECHKGVLPETVAVMNAYANAADYRAVESFDAYPITGDAEGWLATINIPAITVELSTHEVIEWEKNIAGVNALFNLYTKDSAP